MDSNATDVVVETPDGVVVLPGYVPTIEETIKASGGHRQMTLRRRVD